MSCHRRPRFGSWWYPGGKVNAAAERRKGRKSIGMIRVGQCCPPLAGPIMLHRRMRASPAIRIYAATLIAQALGLVITVLTARLLTVADFGLMAQILIWIGFLPYLFTCGVPDALIVTSGSGREGMARVFSAACTYFAFLAGVAGLVTWLCVRELLPVNTVTAVLMALSVVLAFASSFVMSIEERLRAFDEYNRLLILTNVVTLVLLAPFLLWPNWCTVAVVLCARLVGNASIVLLRLWKRREFIRSRAEGPATVWRSVAKTGMRFHCTDLLIVLATRLEQILAVHYLTPVALGAYGAILPVSIAVKSFAGAVGLAGLVRVTSARGSRSQGTVLDRQLRISWIGTLLVAGPLCLLSAIVLPRVYGPKFGDIAWSAVLLVAGGALYAMIDLQIRLLRGIDLAWPGVVARVCTVIFVGIFGPVLLVRYGVAGAGYLSVSTGLFAHVILSVTRRIAVPRKLDYFPEANSRPARWRHIAIRSGRMQQESP